MRWFPRKQEQKAPKVERKSLTLGTSDALGKFLIFGEGSAASPSSALHLYEQSSAVAIPVNMIAEAFSVITPSLSIDGKLVKQHPVLDFLKKPSPWFSTELLLDTLAKNYLVTGESAMVALGTENRPPLELMPISPKSLSPTRGGGGGMDAPARWFISGNTLTGNYEAEERGTDVRYFDGPLRELKVIRSYSTRDNSLLRGQSPLISASREARSHILGTEHNVQILERGGRVSLVFHFDEDLQDDEFEKLKERVRAQYGGASKAGEIGVTSGPGMSIKELGVNPKDMDFGNLHEIAQNSMAMVYRVPLPLVTASRQTLNNYLAAKTALYDDAVLPLSRRILGGLADFLFPRFGLDPNRATLLVNHDDVSALVTRRNDELLKRSRLRVETDNEMRALLGREPYEGGDVIFKDASQIPAGSDVFTDDNDPALLPDERDGE